MLNEARCKQLAPRLLQTLSQHQDKLVALSMAATGNDQATTLRDLASSQQFLGQFSLSGLPQMRKPKGRILVMLSYNEPLLLSVVPLFCAIVMGNHVTIRPSSKNVELCSLIWQELIDELQLDATIVTTPVDQLEDVIQTVKAVYFFGSYVHAQSVYQLCAKHFVEFIPEVETADTKVLHSLPDDPGALKADITNTLANAFDHNGKMCQRISGVYVQGDVYEQYAAALQAELAARQFEPVTVLAGDDPVQADIDVAQAAHIYRHNNSYVVFGPADSRTFTTSAYFAETLWVQRFTDSAQLISRLNARRFFMGLNIVSQSQAFIDEVIGQTNFSRYTLTINHCDITNDTGWGGNWPSGSDGYKSWYDAFSNAYTIIA